MTDSINKVQSFVHRLPRPGRPFRFKSASELWDRFIEYCDDVENNPWQLKTGSNSIQGNGKASANSMRQEVRVLPRAYTLHGFCTFCGIASKWADFKKSNLNRKGGFKETIYMIENVIISQQLDGALIHQFDSSIVARLNGIADKQIQEITGKDGEEFKFPTLSSSDIDELKKINGL